MDINRGEKEEILDDIRTCEELIIILKNQIRDAIAGIGLIIPGTTLDMNLVSWNRSIRRHERTIAKLRTLL